MSESYMEVTSHTVWCTINTGTLKSRLWTFKSGSCGLVCITLSIICALTQSCALALIFFSHEILLVFTIPSRTVNGNTILTTWWYLLAWLMKFTSAGLLFQKGRSCEGEIAISTHHPPLLLLLAASASDIKMESVWASVSMTSSGISSSRLTGSCTRGMMCRGCASVLNTHSSNGITEDGENKRYRYFRVSARK